MNGLVGIADSRGRKGKFSEIVKGQSQKLRSKFRKAITGDEKKRVRDHVQEQPDYVKLFDKIAFTLGLLNILACEYFLVKLPTYFWLWYSLVIPLLILTRISHFKSLGWQYFLLDFCYFVLFCVFVNLYIFSDSQLFFKVCFIYANGPLTWAIVIWRNSLVFHDYDKITSVYIHFFPCLLYYAGRWYGHNSISLFKSSSFIPSFSSGFSYISSSSINMNEMEYVGDTMGNCVASDRMAIFYDKLTYSDYLVAALGYLFWQICYFTKTEIMDKMKLDSRPDLLTSLRWMSSDKKNFFAKFVLGICKRLGFLKLDEHFDSNTMKTKMIFMGAQFIYSVVTFLPTLILYNSQLCHGLFIIFIFLASAFNGASFYIEVFSKVYQLKIDKLLQIKMLAEAVTKESSCDTSTGVENIDIKIPDNIKNEGDDDFEGSLVGVYSPISDYDNCNSSYHSSAIYGEHINRILTGDMEETEYTQRSETKEGEEEEEEEEYEEEEEDILSDDDDIITDRTKSVKVTRTGHILNKDDSQVLSLSGKCASCVEISKEAFEKIKEKQKQKEKHKDKDKDKEKEKKKVIVQLQQDASVTTTDGREHSSTSYQ